MGKNEGYGFYARGSKSPQSLLAGFLFAGALQACVGASGAIIDDMDAVGGTSGGDDGVNGVACGRVTL